VNGPLGGAAAASQGKSAALIIGGVCVLTGLLYGVGVKAFAGSIPPQPIMGWVLTGLEVKAAFAAIAAERPSQRFEACKNPIVGERARRLVEAHLLSGSGSGRWLLWASAPDEFESKPLHGRGAGSYDSWWAKHG